jgi:prophage regulatory protein
MKKLLLKPVEAAELLGIGRSKAYELLAQGALPTVRIGKSVRIPAEELRKWIQAQVELRSS